MSEWAHVVDAVQAAANAEHPKEACGFVLADGQVVSCVNVDEWPWGRFTIDPEEAQRWWDTGDVAAVWHSHPEDPALPSELDEELAPPGVHFLVYSVLDEDLGVYLRTEPGGPLGLREMVMPT